MDLLDFRYLISDTASLLLPRRRPAPGSGEWFYFLHLPKTAGTSFRYALLDQFCAREVYPNAFDYYLRHRGRYLSFETFQAASDRIFPPTVRLLAGHFGIAPLTQRLRDRPPRVVTLLRDPVARMRSSIRYNSHRGRRYAGRKLEDILDSHGAFEGSLQARALGFDPKRGNLDEALARLESIDAVGLVEHYARSLELINRTFGWRLEHRHRRNASRPGSGPPVSDAAHDRMYALSAPDRSLYERARLLFEQRCRESGISD